MRPIRERLLNVLPADVFHLDRLLSLTALEIDRSTSTAAIECLDRPTIHINPDFVANHCETDPKLFMLLMHELMHHVLGHTQLFGYPTAVSNIVFDAVINATLCQRFQLPAYTDFFTQLYSHEEFPERLLRPPPGWPEQSASCLTHERAPSEQAAMEMLYDRPWQQISHERLFALLEPALKAAEEDLLSSCLIGGHQESSTAPVQQDFLEGVIRETKERWIREAGSPVKASIGDVLLGQQTAPRDLARAVRALVRRALRLDRKIVQPRRPRPVEVRSPAISWRDRKVHAVHRATGSFPLLQTTELFESGFGRASPPAIVYLDTSASMFELLPKILPVLGQFRRARLCVVHGFSTSVKSMDEAYFRKGSVPSTMGTDVGCVFDHSLALHPTPPAILIITDGGFSSRSLDARVEQLRKQGTRIFVGWIGGSAHVLWADASVMLPHA